MTDAAPFPYGCHSISLPSILNQNLSAAKS